MTTFYIVATANFVNYNQSTCTCCFYSKEIPQFVADYKLILQNRITQQQFFEAIGKFQNILLNLNREKCCPVSNINIITAQVINVCNTLNAVDYANGLKWQTEVAQDGEKVTFITIKMEVLLNFERVSRPISLALMSGALPMGTNVQYQPPQYAPEQPKLDTQPLLKATRFCTKCGSEVASDANFCFKCGTAVKE